MNSQVIRQRYITPKRSVAFGVIENLRRKPLDCQSIPLTASCFNGDMGSNRAIYRKKFSAINIAISKKRPFGIQKRGALQLPKLFAFLKVLERGLEPPQVSLLDP